MAGRPNDALYIGVTSNPVQRAGHHKEGVVEGMDKGRQSRVEGSSWRDLRLDWIPAFCGNDVVMQDGVVMPSILCMKAPDS